MRQNVKLFINDQQIDFAEPFHILMTYTMEDVTAPPAVKNNYTKTVEVNGTDHNNRIFANLWNVQRIADGASYDFDLTRKNDFKLYLNSELMETGYVKLDSIKLERGEVTYCMTLYGGLGDFFFCLDSDKDGNKRKLSDLDFGGGEHEFDMVLDASTVNTAWNSLYAGNNNIFAKINFAPCSNGIPEDFGSNKILVKMEDNPWGYQPGTGLSGNRGYFMAELPKNVNEWQARDLRAYMQRPVLRLKSLMEAICDPRNNGGYSVHLDPAFFNRENPYYEKAWITLPMLPEINSNKAVYGKGIDGSAGLVNIEKRKKKATTLNFPGATWEDGDKANVKVKFSLYTNGQGGTKELSTSCFEDATAQHGKYHYYGAYFVQLVAKDSKGNYVAGSDIQFYGSFINRGAGVFGYTPLVDTRYTYFGGLFSKGQSGWEFPRDPSISIKDVPLSKGMTFELVVSREEYTNYPSVMPYNALFRRPSSDKDPIKVDSLGWSVKCQDIEATIEIAKDSSLNNLNKKKILNSSNSPLSYLTSYTKQFGLYFLKDTTRKDISIMSRNTFYNGEIDSLENKIDRSREITIKPLAFDRKWYDFALDIGKSAYAEKYRKGNDIEFGIQRVNTNYDFDKSSKNLLEKNCFKNAVMVREYDFSTTDYRLPGNQVSVPPAFMLGAKVTYWDTTGNSEEKNPIPASSPETTTDLYKDGYDHTPRLNFYADGGKPSDGANVLVFFDGFSNCVNKNGGKYYLQLSDDIPEMLAMNDGQPCWQEGNGIDVWKYPVFSRYWTKGTRSVVDSFNEGNPLETYTYDYTFNDSSSIYAKYWKKFIADQYDKNTRVLECWVLLDRRVMLDYLRKFFYFSGSYWCLVEVIDYDLCGYSPTKCKFVKVQELDNYRNGQSL